MRAVSSHESSAKAIGFRLRNLLLSYINESLLALQTQQPESVYETRRNLKKIRAILRLVRQPLDQKIFKKEDSHFRDIHHGLSNLRDEQVQNALAYRYTGQTPTANAEEAVNPLIFIMVSRRLEHAYKRLQRYAPWEFSELQLWQGLEQLYRKGQECYAVCQQQSHINNLHAWRKQSKYLENSLQVIEVYCKKKETFTAVAKDLANLNLALGEAHDLALFVQQYPEHTETLAAQQQELEKAAWSYGQRLYHWRAKDFIAQLKSQA
jgi:hypothetical protein